MSAVVRTMIRQVMRQQRIDVTLFQNGSSDGMDNHFPIYTDEIWSVNHIRHILLIYTY